MVYLFLAQGFEEIEALTPVDILRRAGIEIRTVSIYDTLEVEGRSKIRVVADCSIGEIDVEKMEMAILPGGMPGTANLESNEKIQQIIGQALKQDKWVAAICAAPTILGKQGYLSGREAVCYPGCEEDLKGASIGTKNVVKCGNIITSKGAGTAVDFSLAIVAALRGEELAEKIKKQIIYHQ